MDLVNTELFGPEAVGMVHRELVPCTNSPADASSQRSKFCTDMRTTA